MSSQGFREKLGQYASDLLKHYGIDVKTDAGECQQKVDIVGIDKKGIKVNLIIDISGELDGSADTIVCNDRLFIVRYGLTTPKFYKNVIVTDVKNLETLLRRFYSISSEVSMYEKSYKDYIKLQSPEPEMLRSLLNELFSTVDAKLVENTLLKIYASGRNVVDRIEPGKKTSFIRDRFVRVLEDLDLIFLSEITPGDGYTLYIYACTQQGIVIAQKLAQETFLQKQSVVGLWLDRHDPQTCFLAAWAAMKGSVYQNYPVCVPVKRDETTRIIHIPCPLLGLKRCDSFLNEQFPVELSLFADSILGGKTISEKIYGVLYELTASYLTMLSRVQIAGNDVESICIVPELAKSIFDATQQDFVSKFSNSKLMKSINSYSAAISLISIDLESDEALKVMNLYGISREEIISAYEDLLGSGSVKKESPTVYSAVNWDLLVKSYLEKIDAISAELEII